MTQAEEPRSYWHFSHWVSWTNWIVGIRWTWVRYARYIVCEVGPLGFCLEYEREADNESSPRRKGC